MASKQLYSDEQDLHDNKVSGEKYGLKDADDTNRGSAVPHDERGAETKVQISKIESEQLVAVPRQGRADSPEFLRAAGSKASRPGGGGTMKRSGKDQTLRISKLGAHFCTHRCAERRPRTAHHFVARSKPINICFF
jgi:hypothetical protein